MKLLGFKVRLSVNVLNLRRPLSIVIRCASLFGVGGSGRSPVSLLTSSQGRRGTEAAEHSAPRDKEFISKVTVLDTTSPRFQSMWPLLNIVETRMQRYKTSYLLRCYPCPICDAECDYACKTQEQHPITCKCKNHKWTSPSRAREEP